MSEIIKIKKGLTINLKGKAEKIFVKAKPAGLYAVKPTDFHGLIPKLCVKVDDRVKAGSPLFFDKYRPEIKFTSPVSGTVVQINRGERRKIMEVVIEPDETIVYEDFTAGDPSQLDAKDITGKILSSGLWPVIRQRPYNLIANPSDKPKAIFISAFDTAPLAPDYDFMLKDYGKEFQSGIDALHKLTAGKIHLNIDSTYPASSTFMGAKGVQINKFRGPHPAGNVGTQIHYIDPINKGEVVWVVSPQDVIAIGRLFQTGHYDASRIIALTGSEVKAPKYFKTLSGACVRSITDNNVREEGNIRYISGNVLTGTKVAANNFIGYYDSQLTVIPEGDKYEFMGWLAPGLNKFSLSRTFFSWLMPNKEYVINTNLKGGKRALMITGNFERVFPMNIYPMQLIKAIIIEDIELMENLGIYEVAEEDFALCEFVDTSKTDIQEIIRKGLDLMHKEMN
ncbi:MAG: Na(+)-translocating NADH-quinone reductase subunit A [Bacteroidales bacterium]|nr:Na(+)-translocating NADH-quinone reductase subunit A [Bacteroidales bacterium]